MHSSNTKIMTCNIYNVYKIYNILYNIKSPRTTHTSIIVMYTSEYEHSNTTQLIELLIIVYIAFYLN